MSLFIALESELIDFDATTQARMDLPVTSLTITHKENHYAHALLQTTTRQLPPDLRWIFISQKMPDGTVACLFRGHLEKAPHQMSTVHQTLEFIAKPQDEQEQTENLVAKHKQSALFDPLLFKEDDTERFDVIKTSKPIAFYCDPISLKITPSCLFNGTVTHDITQSCLAKSLEIRLHKKPLSRLTVTLEAQWIQYTFGWVNLGRRIAKTFPDQTISTFTPKSLQRTWPKTGQIVGKSGYWVAFSKLEERSAYADGLPHTITCWRNHNGKSQKHTLKRTWFDASLVIGWRIKQKRTERLTFTIEHHHQGTLDTSASITIPLKRPLSEPGLHPFWMPYTPYSEGDVIQNGSHFKKARTSHTSGSVFDHDDQYWENSGESLCLLPHESAHSFFLSDRGKKTFHAAVEMAKTAIAHTARAYYITATLSPHLCGVLSLNDLAIIRHASLPQGCARGKIIHLKREACGKTNTHTLTVTLAVSIGQSFESEPRADAFDSYSDGYAENYTFQESMWHETPDGLTYPSFEDQYPTDDYAKLWTNQNQDITRSVHLSYDPEAQCDIAQKHSSEKNPLGKKDISTHLGLHFRQLKTRDNVTHTITVKKPLHWSSPQHIILGDQNDV